MSTREFAAVVNDTLVSTSRTVRHVIVHPDVAKSLKLSTSDIVAIVPSQGSSSNSISAFAIGTIWPSQDCSPGCVQLSLSLLLTVCLSPDAKIQLFPLTPHQTMSELPTLKAISPAKSMLLLIRECFVNLKYITPNTVLEIPYEGTLHRIRVEKIQEYESDDQQLPALQNLSLLQQNRAWIFNWDSTIIMGGSSVPPTEIDTNIERLPSQPSTDAYASIGGLSKQIAEIRDLLEIPLTRPELFHHLGLKPPRGILLHGPPGTGKTHLARAIAASTKSSVLVVNGPELSSAYHGETESKLRDVFREAREKSPCIVVLDEVDALVPRRDESSGGEVEKRVVATLLTILDGMQEHGAMNKERVTVIGTTNRPNAIDPALRRPGRFDKEIEIGIPDAEARFHILKVLLVDAAHSITDIQLQSFASTAHGYVGADLGAVVREAGTIAIKRFVQQNPSPSNAAKGLTITLHDLLMSLPAVRPSAMRSLFVEAPTVRYTDIGGQSEVIQKLREAVEWPLLHPEAFQRLGVKPPKGVLLYGPPGCSKTVLARACACESGVNFVAVKGPELLNKYVGESERAVREIFRKARAAAPSIVFFDEIDALGTSRSADEGSAGSAHEGVLTSLLNEMDGVQELVGVTVIAATNRPESLDSALMRPGRLDRMLYVGPPDHDARKEILAIRLREMKVDPGIDLHLLAQKCEGCSGAEITAMCQEAALFAMNQNMDISHVPKEAFYDAALKTKRQITPKVIERFQRWSELNS
ncbi:AAA family ATPase [Flagelloscypha sp. PMI_526]|nr:AAA family ATPase [Flagelloscypha sp. PMI_526]